MSFWELVALPIAFLAGGLYSFWRNRTTGLYMGPLDDRFLWYFKPGEEYSVLEMIKLVDEKTKGEVRLGLYSFRYWLDGCVKKGKLGKRMVTRTTKKGSFQVEAYSLPRR